MASATSGIIVKFDKDGLKKFIESMEKTTKAVKELTKELKKHNEKKGE